MRDIKFRGKTIGDGKWIYGYLMNMHDDDRLFIGTWKNIGGEATIKDELFFSYKEVDPKTVGQYIGLKDSKGVEIYKGDIIEGNLIKYSPLPTMGEVVWDSYWASFANKNEAGNTLLQEIDLIRVIGNLYERPEFLQTTNDPAPG